MISQERLIMGAMPSMNDTHLEDMLLINRLSKAAQNNDLPAVRSTLDELIEHTIEHFKNEEEMMLEHQFPPYPHHKEEHDKALRELQEISAKFDEDENTQDITKYIDTIFAPWFLQHVELLDGVTAMFLADPQEHLKRWQTMMTHRAQETSN